MRALQSTWLMAVTPLLGALAPAWAQDAPDLKLNASYAVQSDSNLFRLSAGADVNALVGQPSATERIGVTSVGLSLATSQSLQKFEFGASVVDYRYQNFSYLSFTAANYNAAWRWSVTPRLNGTLSTESRQALASFADYQGYTTRNQRTDANTRLDTVYEVTGPWRLVAGATQSSQSNQQAAVAGVDYSSTAVDVGVRHVLSSGSTITYRAKVYNGSYLNRPLNPIGLYDDRFEQTDHDLRMHWALSGKSSAYLGLTGISRSHPHFAQRDYTGFNTGAGVKWAITGKTGLTADYAHELSSYQTSTSSYSQTDRISLGPAWQISPKALLSLRHIWSQIDYLGTPALLASSTRRDTTRDTTLSFSWQPYQALTFSVALQNSVRGSTQAGLDYDSTMATLSAQYSY